MSLCPHHCLRWRLYGLSSSAQRPSPGRWHRGSGNPSTGYGIYHASTHITSVTEEPDVAGHGPSFVSSSSERSVSEKAQTKIAQTSKHPPTNRSAVPTQDPTLSSLALGGSRRSRRRATPLLSMTKTRKIIAAQGLHPNLAHYVARRINAQIRSQNRFINPRSVHLATVIRLNSLYSRELGVRQWQAAYKEIYKAKHYQRPVDKRAQVPQLKEEGRALLQKIRTDCQGSFREAWRALPRSAKAAQWQRLAFELMQHDPELTLEFLMVTTESEEKPDFIMVAECLLYLDNFYYDERLKDWRSGPLTYQAVIRSCLDPKSWPILSLPQKGVRLYIRRADHEGVALALRLVAERSIQMTAETALCFVYRFSELHDVDRALEAFKYIPKLKDPQLTMDSEGVMRHCCKLLTLDSVKDGPRGRNFRILPQLLKMGVRPDRDMMNVVLSNALKTGDAELGAEMLRFMKGHGHELDSYTYVTLLTDAVARGDRGYVDSLVQEIMTQGEHLQMNPYVSSKIFHTHYVFTAKHMDVDADPSRVFYSMLDMYNRLHDITPLKDLLIIPPHYTPPAHGANTAPSPVALYIMIATYFRCQNRFSNAQRIYVRFRELVLQGHESVAPLTQTDHTYNEFLIAFRSHPRGLRSCVRLVEDMLQEHPDPLPNTTIRHTKPSARTWTILLSAFIFHKQLHAAEKVKEMMAKHGVQYNEVTWNIIINGYANAQNIPETAAAIKMMEEQGFSIDPYTMKSLRYLRDPERLWVAIDEMDQKSTEFGQHQPPAYPDPQSDVHNDIKERDQLIEQGLEQLSSKMKPKL